MKITIFVGDLVDATAEALCTSTNPRLSLMMGTGAAVRARGGYEILRECEAIIAASGRTTVPPGSVHVTRAGALPAKRIIHCVASDDAHRSSDDIIRLCVRNALAAADAEGCRTVAMPVFASGHARVKFDRAAALMAATIGQTQTNVTHIYIVVHKPDDVDAARHAFANAPVELSAVAEEQPISMWDIL